MAGAIGGGGLGDMGIRYGYQRFMPRRDARRGGDPHRVRASHAKFRRLAGATHEPQIKKFLHRQRRALARRFALEYP